MSPYFIIFTPLFCFALDEDRRVPVHDAEVSEMTALNGVALVVGREKELLVEGDATERQFDSQCVLVHVLVEEGSEVFVHLLARTQGRVDELFVCGFVCVSHSIWVENYNNYSLCINSRLVVLIIQCLYRLDSSAA